MKTSYRYIVLVILLGLLVAIAAYFGLNIKNLHQHAANGQKGIHDGKLLTKDDFKIEVTMFEKGMPPHFRVYIYKNNKLLEPKKINLEMTLKRFSGEISRITFTAIHDFLQSDQIIKEPHSFDVTVNFDYKSKKYMWHYSSYEGRIILHPKIIQAADIEVTRAVSRVMQKKINVFGKIVPNQNQIVSIVPRYPGIIKSLNKNLGDPVRQGEKIAVIESNDSLQQYTITSPITGVIVKKNSIVGSMAHQGKSIYEIANLNNVWANLTLYRKEASLIKKGMTVIVMGEKNGKMAQSTISYISPLGIETNQTISAHAVLDNSNQQWFPGMYIKAAIVLKSYPVAVAVPTSAIQKWRGWNVVFVKHGNTFEATPVTLGMHDGNWVEIISGLKTGQQYVVKNSFYLKADLEKAGAAHDH